MKKREFLSLGGAVPLMLAGCGSSGSGGAQVRLVNASVGYASLGLRVVDTVAATGVAFGTASTFSGVPADAASTVLVDASTSSDLVAQTRTLSKDGKYSIVAYGYAGSPKSVLLTESQVAPAAGYASLSVLNTSVDVGAVDIYLTPTTDISSATPLASTVTGVSQSSFAAIGKGTYVVTVTGYTGGTANKQDVRLQVSGIALADQQIATLILVPGPSGVLANAILLNQGGTATYYANTKVRVRAVGATGNGGTVAVAGVLAATVSPGFSAYTLIDAGAPPAVTVNGVAVAYASGQAALVAGIDYTILVYGSSAAPLVNVITDDNRLPAASTNAKVRLLHAVFNSSSTLTLKVNSIDVASGVAYGTASSYVETAASSSSNVEVKAQFTSILSTTLNIAAGNIYTMVMSGDDSAPNHADVVSDFSAAR